MSSGSSLQSVVAGQPESKEISVWEMRVVSKRSLAILAAIVWYIGGVVLALSARSLLVEARALRPDLGWPWLAAAAGVLIGLVKARYLFSHICHKNLARIAALRQPRWWAFYRPGFFLFLAAMIVTGAVLSRLAHGHYGGLLALGTLDLSLSVALLVSSLVFWRRGAFRP